MPPVGQNATSGNGPGQRLQQRHAAGRGGREELQEVVAVGRWRAITSLAVATPGSSGRPMLRQACPIALRVARADAELATGVARRLGVFAAVRMVPAPTMAPGTERAMASMHCSATGVRSVTSSTLARCRRPLRR
jgi:hypothetical protein